MILYIESSHYRLLSMYIEIYITISNAINNLITICINILDLRGN